MQFGDYRVEIIPDTEFRLDGGAMFGVVPRTLWSTVFPPDDHNRIGMNMNCVYIEAGPERILIETGIGEPPGPSPSPFPPNMPMMIKISSNINTTAIIPAMIQGLLMTAFFARLVAIEEVGRGALCRLTGFLGVGGLDTPASFPAGAF